MHLRALTLLFRRLLMKLLDLLEQTRVGCRPRTGRPLATCIVAAPADTQRATQPGELVFRPMRLNEAISQSSRRLPQSDVFQLELFGVLRSLRHRTPPGTYCPLFEVSTKVGLAQPDLSAKACYLYDLRDVRDRGNFWSWREELNLQPVVYKTTALPLSYASPD
jgi:hypothetical protein